MSGPSSPAPSLDRGDAGSIFLVVAPSGAGKSTLVNALLEQDGGRMKTPTACGNRALTWRAPCQSISSNTSVPACTRCSIHVRDVA